MATLELRLNTDGWQRGIGRLIQRYPSAVSRALNRAATSARVVMVREIARDLGLRQADVSDRISTRLAAQTEFLEQDQLVAKVIATGARIPLYRFRARQTKTGVTARLPGGAGRYPGAFIATMRSGHTGVFKRRSTQRLPITELFGPSVPRVFEKFLPLGVARGQEQLSKNIVHELRFALKESATA